jgi:hypothetical protein
MQVPLLARLATIEPVELVPVAHFEVLVAVVAATSVAAVVLTRVQTAALRVVAAVEVISPQLTLLFL